MFPPAKVGPFVECELIRSDVENHHIPVVVDQLLVVHVRNSLYIVRGYLSNVREV
jgi:hypothetical protein